MTVSVTDPHNDFRATIVASVQVHSFFADPIGHNRWEQLFGPDLGVGFCPTRQYDWATTPTTSHIVSGAAKSLYSERCLT
jgi:hypothetical protein